ncbi:pentapeptide repeat-containing protein, partial [Lacimonas salitolerans]
PASRFLHASGQKTRPEPRKTTKNRGALLYSRAWTWAQNLPAPRADIAQALQVLGRRTADQRRAEAAWPDPPSKDTIWPFDTPCPSLAKTPNEAKRDPQAIEEFKKKLNVWRLAMDRCSGYRLDLRGANLQNADLSAGRPDASDAVFSGAKLSGARMEGASLEGTRMEGTDLKRVTMQGAVAIKARMQGANLFHVEMEGADLTVAVMNNAILVMARIDGADVSGAELIGARCSAVRMEGSDFKWAHMQGTNFERARLEGADLNMALMDEANLSRARLQGASLSTSQLKGTNLKRIRMDEDTFIKDATFQGACLQYADEATARKLAQHCEQIFADGTVTLPNGIGRPAHWPDWELPNTGPHAFDTEWRKWQANPAAYTPPPKPD